MSRQPGLVDMAGTERPFLEELEAVLAVAKAAGGGIMRVLESHGGVESLSVERKEDRTPVTEADRKSHEVIVEGLGEVFPGARVVSEEGGEEEANGGAPGGTAATLRGSAPVWVVDPLDGTKELLKGTGEFTVNIGLVRDGRPVAGVVHAPVLGRSWLGARSGGRRWAELRGEGEPASLSTRRADPSALEVVTSRDHVGDRVRALLGRLPGGRSREMGSSLKFCLIAQGDADLYYRDGPTMEWDTAAAQAVLEGAGGGVFTLDGEPLRYGKEDLRNPHFVAVGDRDLSWKGLV